MTGVQAPASGGTVVLAEPYGGWAATLNGTELKPLTAPVYGWAQGFLLPPGGGRLVITRNDVARDLSLAAELIALLAVCVLALPGKRADPAEEAQALAAARATQQARQARAAQRSDESESSGRAGRRALQAARVSRVSRAAAAGLGAVRRRAAPTQAGAEDPVPTGSGVGVLADGEDPDLTEYWDQEPGPPTGPQPAAMAPWDSGDWGQAPDWDGTAAYAGTADRRDSARWHDAPDWDADLRQQWTAQRDESARWDEPERRDEPAPRAESAERHSHRASRRGRPGRKRGSGDRSGKDGES
jgi:hypothetical protein